MCAVRQKGAETGPGAVACAQQGFSSGLPWPRAEGSAGLITQPQMGLAGPACTDGTLAMEAERALLRESSAVLHSRALLLSRLPPVCSPSRGVTAALG